MKMLRILNTKVLPLILSATIIINVQLPLYAQQKPYTKPYTAAKDNTNVVNRQLEIAIAKAVAVPKIPYTLTFEEVSKAADKEAKDHKLLKEDYEDIYNQYLASLKGQDIQVSYATAILRKEYRPEGLISYFQNKASKEGIVCEGKICYPVEVWLHGVLRVILYQSTGQDTNHKQFKENRDIMLASVPHIYDIVMHYGLNRNDAYSLQKHLRFVLKGADKYCDNDTYTYDIAPGFAGGEGRADARQGKERRQKECENIGKAMLTLAMIGPWEQDRNQNAKDIYDVVRDTHDDDYGAITLSTGINALMAVDNTQAYEFIENILTKDTVPTGTTLKAIENFGTQLLDLLSISAWANKGIEAVNISRGGGGRYLNDYNQTLQYIDEEYSRASGISDFGLSAIKANPSLGYNVSYRNVLEDIGIMLGNSKSPAAVKLSKKIISKYISEEAKRPACLAAGQITLSAFELCSPGKKMHIPLVTGILQGAEITDNTAAKIINTLDWWDLNEGTQRRINNTVTDKYSGTVKRTLDEAKKKRNDQNKKIATASLWADILVSAVFITLLAKSLPSMVKSVANAARTMRATVSGKGNLLKIVRTNIKTGGVNPAKIKLARQAANIEKMEAVKAEQLLKQRGINKGIYGNTLQKSATPNTNAAANASNGTRSPAGTLNVKVIDNNGVSKNVTATYSNTGKVKLEFSPADTPLLKAEGTLQESKQISEQKNFFNNLTAQIGEGSGGGSGSVSGSNVRYIKNSFTPQPSLTTNAEVFKPITRNITTTNENKIISAERIKKAAFLGNIDYYKNLASSVMSSIRNRTGALTMAINLSLVSPTTMNGVSAGRIMPIIDRISTYDKTASAILKSFSTKQAAAIPAESSKIATAYESVHNSVLINAVKADKITKVSIRHVPYGAFSQAHGIARLPKYLLRSSLWLSMLALPTGTPAKPVIFLKEKSIPQTTESFERHITELGSTGYQSLLDNAVNSIHNAAITGQTISGKTIASLKEAFADTHAPEEFDILFENRNIRKLLFISPYISKSLFDRMMALLTSPDADRDAAVVAKTKSKKGVKKLLENHKQKNRTFDNFFNAISGAKSENPAMFFTLDNQKTLSKDNFDASVITAQEDLLPTMIKSFFQTKAIKDILISKIEKMSFNEKEAIMSRIIDLGKKASALEQSGYAKKAIKPVLIGKTYQWEDMSEINPSNIVLSVEVNKGDIGLEISRWIQKRNIPSGEADYSKYIPAWIADQLGLTAEKPGKLVWDEQTFNHFIYNPQGTARIRFGQHEVNPSNSHIHIERINTNGEWEGIVNEAYTSGPSEEIKEKAERAKSFFEQNIEKTENQLNRQAEDVGKTFMPIASYLGSAEVYKAAAEIAKAANKPQAVKNLLKMLEDASAQKHFHSHVNELKAQGLIK